MWLVFSQAEALLQKKTNLDVCRGGLVSGWFFAAEASFLQKKTNRLIL